MMLIGTVGATRDMLFESEVSVAEVLGAMVRVGVVGSTSDIVILNGSQVVEVVGAMIRVGGVGSISDTLNGSSKVDEVLPMDWTEKPPFVVLFPAGEATLVTLTLLVGRAMVVALCEE